MAAIAAPAGPGAVAAAGITGNAGGAAGTPASTATGVVASKELSTDQLARNLANSRKDKDKQATADATKTGDNEGQPGVAANANEHLNDGGAGAAGVDGKETKDDQAIAAAAATPAEIQTGLQTLGLNAAQAAAVEAVLEKGGELDADALKLTDAQVDGLNKLLGAPAEAAKPGEAEEALELDTKFTPEQRKALGEQFKTRIGKVIAKERAAAEAAVTTERTARTAAEQKLAEAQQQLQSARTAPVAASAQPLAEVTSQEQLQAAAKNARDVKAWATQQLRHVARNAESVQKQLEAAGVKLAEYTPEAMEDYLTAIADQADQTITTHVPARHQYLQAEAQHIAQVDKDYPWLNDPKDPRYAHTQGALKMFPEIKRVPHWKAILAIIGRGVEVINAEKAAAAAPAKRPAIQINRKAPKVVVRPSGSRGAASKAEAQTSEAETEFKSTGSVAALTKMFGARRTAA